MKISVRRSGGYAGVTENIALDTERLDTATARRVAQMVEGLGFFDLPAAVSGGTVGADFYRYEITVADGDRQHTVAFDADDSAATAPLRKFVEALPR